MLYLCQLLSLRGAHYCGEGEEFGLGATFVDWGSCSAKRAIRITERGRFTCIRWRYDSLVVRAEVYITFGFKQKDGQLIIKPLPIIVILFPWCYPLIYMLEYATIPLKSSGNAHRVKWECVTMFIVMASRYYHTHQQGRKTCCMQPLWRVVFGALFSSVATLRDQYAQNKVTASQTSWKPTSQTITPIFCRELPVLRVWTPLSWSLFFNSSHSCIHHFMCVRRSLFKANWSPLAKRLHVKSCSFGSGGLHVGWSHCSYLFMAVNCHFSMKHDWKNSKKLLKLSVFTCDRHTFLIVSSTNHLRPSNFSLMQTAQTGLLQLLGWLQLAWVLSFDCVRTGPVTLDGTETSRLGSDASQRSQKGQCHLPSACRAAPAVQITAWFSFQTLKQLVWLFKAVLIV